MTEFYAYYSDDCDKLDTYVFINPAFVTVIRENGNETTLIETVNSWYVVHGTVREVVDRIRRTLEMRGK